MVYPSGVSRGLRACTTSPEGNRSDSKTYPYSHHQRHSYSASTANKGKCHTPLFSAQKIISHFRIWKAPGPDQGTRYFFTLIRRWRWSHPAPLQGSRHPNGAGGGGGPRTHLPTVCPKSSQARHTHLQWSQSKDLQHFFRRVATPVEVVWDRGMIHSFI